MTRAGRRPRGRGSPRCSPRSPRRRGANPESEALRAKAANHIYNLDHDLALATFRQAVAADPAGRRRLPRPRVALWLSITFRRGNMTVDDYLGRPNKPNANPLPHAAARDGRRLPRGDRPGDRARAAAHRRRTRRTPTRTTSSAPPSACARPTPPRSRAACSGAFRAAREAYDEHEKVLDARSRSARTPASSSAPIATSSRRCRCRCGWSPTWPDSAAARTSGIKLIEEAAAYGGDNQTDARFALILLYNREKRYDDALKQLATLRERYPRNRLVWLEIGIDVAARRPRRPTPSGS